MEALLVLYHKILFRASFSPCYAACCNCRRRDPIYRIRSEIGPHMEGQFALALNPLFSIGGDFFFPDGDGAFERIDNVAACLKCF